MPCMLEYHSQLYDQAYRYRRVMLTRVESAVGFEKEHREIAELVLRRDFEAASARLRKHIDLTRALTSEENHRPRKRKGAP